MKANRTVREMGQDADAVTSVLGAILVTVIVVGILVTIRVQYVPVWEQNAEAAQALLIENQLAGLKAQLDRQASNATAAEVATQLSLASTRSSIFSPAKLPGSLGFEPGSQSMQVSTTRLLVILANGTLTPIADNTWEDIPATTSVSDVLQVAALRLRIDQMDDTKAGRQVTVTLTDPSNSDEFEGSFTVRVSDPPGADYLVHYEVRNTNNVVVSTITDSFAQSAPTISPFYVNLLDPNYVFDQVLAIAPKPMKVTLTHDSGFSADYSIAYLKTDGSGQSILVGGGGATKAPYAQGFTSGKLVFTSSNSFYVNQKYVLENGALILEQPDGAAFKVEPNLHFVLIGGIVGASLTLPSIAGEATNLAGDLSATVFSTALGGTSLQGLAPVLTLNVTTDYPDLWASFFRAKLEAIGLSDNGSLPHFAISTSAGRAVLTLYSLQSDPTSTDNDISVRLVQANVQLRFVA